MFNKFLEYLKEKKIKSINAKEDSHLLLVFSDFCKEYNINANYYNFWAIKKFLSAFLNEEKKRYIFLSLFKEDGEVNEKSDNSM